MDDRKEESGCQTMRSDSRILFVLRNYLSLLHLAQNK